jgi:hypothetical protein
VADVPSEVAGTALWGRVSERNEFATAIADLRAIAADLAAKTSECLPGFTDHSIIHFDALWRIAGEVFTIEELSLFTPSEAFILGASFYVHDLGLSIPATLEGRRLVQEMNEYKSRCRAEFAGDGAQFDPDAMVLAVRDTHAKFARQLCTQPLPGLPQYLIENTEIRTHWSEWIADVSESHVWSVAEVDNRIGNRGVVPSPVGDKIDLGFVACALRLCDAAHINGERASRRQQMLRSHVSDKSEVHWTAQASIAGPKRDGAQLVYSTTASIPNVDAWWMFYELAEQLDKEIYEVAQFLADRTWSQNRFSLRGVKGVRNPTEFAVYVKPAEFEPVDVRFKSTEIERLITMLGGESLYGRDPLVPLRELLQNARDAVLLRQATASDDDPYVPWIKVGLETSGDETFLVVADNGVGMNRHIITNYLLSIAANYWDSEQFSREYPGAKGKGFKSVGRFGIGFLSVFMIGDAVEVTTRRRNCDGITVKFNEIGRRGSLKSVVTTFETGTRIRVRLRKQFASAFDNLAAIVRWKAPMLEIPMQVSQGESPVRIEPDWWKNLNQAEFMRFLGQFSRVGRRERHLFDSEFFITLANILHVESEIPAVKPQWTTDAPETVTDEWRIIANPFSSFVLVCLQGFAVTAVHMPGLSGIVNVANATPDASRQQLLDLDAGRLRTRVLDELQGKIVAAINQHVEVDVQAKIEFLSRVGGVYGQRTLCETALKWIPTVDRQGNVYLNSPTEFAAQLRQCQTVCIVYHSSMPWKAISILRRLFPDAPSDALLVPLPELDSTSAGDYRHDEPVDGEFRTHFDSYKRDRLPAIHALFKIIAGEWNTDEVKLENMRWRHIKQMLAGILVRPT